MHIVMQCSLILTQCTAMVGRETTLIIAGDNLIVITIVTVPQPTGTCDGRILYRSQNH